MYESAVPQQLDLPAIRARRANLRRACARLKDALALPRGAGAAWVGEVTPAMHGVAVGWETHIALTESPDGVLAQIVDDAPRLARQVGRLQAEHAEIGAGLRIAGEHLAEADLAEADLAGLARVQAELGVVLDRIARHRVTGGELIYQAYQIDIGGE
jgi:hypothetical protein